jgi:pimeloyl-ACP methyl ester carboxylesterase
MAPFVRPLMNAGHGVVLFDGPGHGASSGRLASVPLFAAAVRAMASHLGTVRAAVAHSMGAPATALAALDGLPLEAAVFVAPPRSPAAFFDHFCAAFGMPPSLAEGVRARLERRFGMRLVDLDLPRFARRATLPLLVVHDADDKEVPWENGDAIAGAWPGARLLTTTGLGHRRVLRDPDVLTRATAFIADRLRSGARVCASPSCGRALRGSWDEAQDLCSTCALEAQLFSPTLRAQMGLDLPSHRLPAVTRIAAP